MPDWDAYGAYVAPGGVYARERNIERLRGSIELRLPDSPSYKAVKIKLPGESDMQEQAVAIIATDEELGRKICAMPGQSLRAGSLVYWADAVWMITYIEPDDEVYVKGSMTRCNYLLKFRLPDGSVAERNCIVKDVTKYLVGENRKETLTIGDSRMSLTVAKDSVTRHIKRGTRVLVDDPDADETIAYEVTKPDRVTGVYDSYGVYKFLVRETAFGLGDDGANLIPGDNEHEPGKEGWF